MIYAVDESNLRRQELLAEEFRPSTTELLRDLSVPEGADVLDVGCGIGQTTRLLKDMLPSPDRGVDLNADPDLLEVARARSEAGETGLAHRKGDAAGLTYEEDTFDVISPVFCWPTSPILPRRSKSFVASAGTEASSRYKNRTLRRVARGPRARRSTGRRDWPEPFSILRSGARRRGCFERPTSRRWTFERSSRLRPGKITRSAGL